ncbi:hypothetical protein ACFQ1R_00010 [Mariniflexile jejuense]|uniref:Uncharacterized protein n=1 Tax=Mariniflexile jejuense TaxID=1173582 RepID=A0ABW3JDB5_9FLAO
MSTEQDIDEEPKEGNDSSSEKTLHKKKGAYQKLKRDLSEEELNSPGTQKLLLSDLDRLEDEVDDLKKFRDDYYESDKKRAILDEKLTASISKEVLYTVAISLGATLIGLSNSIWSADNNNGHIILFSGLILIIGGLISKFFLK